MPQELIAVTGGSAMAVDVARAKKRIRRSLACKLQLARPSDAFRDFARGLARDRRDELRLAWRRDLELDVDAVGKRTRDAAPIARDALGRAATAPAAIAAVSAGAR